MATDYEKLKPDNTTGPYQTITTTGGGLVALYVPEEWVERIIIALKLLDAHERDSRTAAYIEKIKREMGIHRGKSKE